MGLLARLELSHNHIAAIDTDGLPFVQELSIHNNKLRRFVVENSQLRFLWYLNSAHNKVEAIDFGDDADMFVCYLPKIVLMNLSHNQLTNRDWLEHQPSTVASVKLENNQIDQLDIHPQLHSLTEFSIANNPLRNNQPTTIYLCIIEHNQPQW